MNRKSRIVHIFAFVALVANMFAPLMTAQALTLQQMSAFNDSTPAVEYSTSQDDGNKVQPQEAEQPPAPEVPEQPEVPAAPPAQDPPPPAPEPPATFDCGEGVVVQDANGDGVADANDCPPPPAPEPPATFDCGEGLVVQDANGDGVADANDCPPPPAPEPPATFDCGEGVIVEDTNGDGVADAGDCPTPAPATFDCGEGGIVEDTNGDGAADEKDCPIVEEEQEPEEELPATTYVNPASQPLAADVCVDANTLRNAQLTREFTEVDHVTYAFAQLADGNFVLVATPDDGTEWAGDGVFVNWLPVGLDQYINPNGDTDLRVYSLNNAFVIFEPCDGDADGVLDKVDNCPDIANPDQADADGDGIGDACDDVDDREPVVVVLAAEASYEVEYMSGPSQDNDSQETDGVSAGVGDAIKITLSIVNSSNGEIENLRIETPTKPELLADDWTCTLVSDGEAVAEEPVAQGGVVECTATYVVTEEDVESEELAFEFEVYATAVQPEGLVTMASASRSAPEPDATASMIVPMAVTGQHTSFTVAPGGTSVPNGNGPFADRVYVTPGSGPGSGFDLPNRTDTGAHSRNRSGNNYYINTTCTINASSGEWVDSSGSLVWVGGTWAGALGAPLSGSQNIPNHNTPSIGWGGTMDVWFVDNKLVSDGTSAPDLWIQERGQVAEPADVYVFEVGSSTPVHVGKLSSGSNSIARALDIDHAFPGNDARGRIFDRVQIVDNDHRYYGNCSENRNYAGADIDAVWALGSTVEPSVNIVPATCVAGNTLPPNVGPTDTNYATFQWYRGNNPIDPSTIVPGETNISVRATLKANTGGGQYPTRYTWDLSSPEINQHWSQYGADVKTVTRSFTDGEFGNTDPCTPTSFPVVTIGDATCIDEVGKYNITSTDPTNDGIKVQSISPNPALGNTQVTITATVQQGFGWPSDLSTTGLPGSPSWVISGTTATLKFTTPAIDQNPCATPDVKITKTASPTWDLNTNDTFTYTLKVENIGDGAAESVVVEDMLIPTGLTNWSVAPESLDCEIENGLLTCNLGTLQPGANAVEITLTATVISTLACDTYTNTASVSASNEPADVLENNEDSASITVACDNDKITICHATNSDSNPYTSNNLPKSQIVSDNGHWTHTNDIWPAFSYNGEDYEARGNLALLPDCVVPMPELPTPIPAECRNGVVGAPGITFGDGGGVWEFSVDPAAPWTAGQQVSVAATTIDGVIVPDGLPTEWINAGWERVDDHTVKYTFTFETVNCTPTDMPEIAVDLAVCENGEAQPHTLSIPADEGMTVTSVTGAGSVGMSPAAPGFGVFTFPAGNSGDVVITFTIADEYEWGELPTGGDGTWEIVSDTTATFTFALTDNDCVPDVDVTKKVSLNADGEWTDTVEVDEPTTVYFQITVTNTGTANLADVAFDEELTGVELVSVTPDGAITWDNDTELIGTIGSMSPGNTVVVVYSYEITQDHFNSGETIENCASATVDDNIDGQDCATVTIEQNPGFSLAKTAEDSTVTESGVTIVYTVTVTNTGNIDLGSFNIEDDFSHDIEDLIGPTAITGPDGVEVTRVGTSNVFQISSLPVSGVVTFELSYEVTQDDMNEGGEIENCVVELIPQFASADVSSRTVEDPENCHTVTIEQNPEVEATKTTTRTTVSEADTAIEYTITVTNTGNVDLPNLAVTDELTGTATPAGVIWGDLPDGVTLVSGVPTITNLTTGQIVELTASYVVTQDDMNAGGEIENCVDTLHNTTDDEDRCVTTTIEQNPDFSLEKEASVTEVTTAPTQIIYTITVTNTGNTDLDDFVIEDVFSHGDGAIDENPFFGGKVSGPDDVTITPIENTNKFTVSGLDQGDSASFQVIYNVTLEDMDRGETIENCIWGEEDVPQTGGSSDNLPNCAQTTIEADPEVAVAKGPVDASVSPGIDDDARVAFNIFIRNEGNISLDTVTVTDPDLGSLPATGWTAYQVTFNGAGDEVLTVVAPDTAFTYTMTGPFAPGELVTLRIVSDVIPVDQIELPDSEWCGTWANTATVTGTYANGDAIVTIDGEEETEGATTNEAEVLVNCTGLSIDKSSSVVEDVKLEPGQTFQYTLDVDNNGNTDVYNVTVTDGQINPMLTINSATINTDPVQDCAVVSGDVTCEIGTLGAGESVSITISVTVPGVGGENGITWEQCNATLTNQAQIDGDFSLTPPPTIQISSRSITPPGTDIPSDTVSNTIECDLDLELEKTAASLNDGGDGVMHAGDTITYEFEVTNNSAITLYNIDVTDQLPVEFVGDVDTIDSLAPEASETLTATYVVSQTDLDNGSVRNCADAAGSTTEGDDGTSVPANESCKTTKLEAKPSLDLEKSGEQNFGEDGRIDAGDVIEYTFTVENTGNVTLTNIEVIDLLPGLTWVGGNTIAELAPGQSEELTATYIATQTMIDIGDFQNCAIAGADGPIVDIEDLAVETRQVEEPYVESNEACDEQTFVPDPSLVLEKSGEQIFGEDGRIDAGDVIEYTFTIENTGNVTLTNIEVIDLLPGLTWVDGNTIVALAPGQSAELTATYIATQTMIDIGEFQNCAIAEADGPIVDIPVPVSTSSDTPAATVESNEACDEQTFVPDPSLELEKSGEQIFGEDGRIDAGDVIEYTFTIENTGNVTLTNIEVVDLLPGLTWVDGNTIVALAPGQSAELTATYIATQTMIDIVEFQNCAIAEADGPIVDIPVPVSTSSDTPAATVESNEACDEQTFVPDPEIEVDKDGSDIDMTVVAPDDRIDAGDQITYVFTVENTGNVTLNNLVLDDELIGEGDWGEDGNTIATLAPGETVTRTAVYTIPQEALDLGNVENCVYLEGDGPVVAEQEIRYTSVQTEDVNDEDAFVDAEDCDITPLEDGPAIDIVKTGAVLPGEDGRVDAGDVIAYTFTVKNTGNVTLFNVVVDDPLAGLAWVSDPSIGTMEPGDKVELTANYEVPQTMIDAGEVYNCAGVEAESPDIEQPVLTFAAAQAEDDAELVTDEDCITTDLEQEPDVAFEKTGSLSLGENDELNAGDVIEYTFLVTNTGNVTLEDLEIDDPMEGLEFTGGNTIDSLAPGESVELIAEYEIPQSDVDFGMITNCADVLGMAADGTEVTDDDCDTQLLDQERNLDVFVAQDCPDPAAERLAEGDFSVVYELTIVNDGTVTLHNVTMTASHEGVLNEPFPTTFAPGQSETRQWTIEATEEEFENREINIEVTVVGKTSNGASVLLASMATMQNTGEEVERTLILTCPIDVPAKPVPASPVTDLPKTGSGSVTATASVLWAAAMLSVLALGTTAVGIRRKYRS